MGNFKALLLGVGLGLPGIFMERGIRKGLKGVKRGFLGTLLFFPLKIPFLKSLGKRLPWVGTWGFPIITWGKA